ncbi:methyltransferase domain-containing protein [Anabaena minutissima FACHB-250]|nr:methyltransferase domain-containing protein [Anabaena minutissima FACHB-250]
MVKSYVTSAFVQALGSEVFAVFGWSQRQTYPIIAKSWLATLEIFICEHNLEAAYQKFQVIQSTPISQSITTAVLPYKQPLTESKELLVFLGKQKLTILGNGFKSYIDQENTLELNSFSQTSPQVLLELFAQQKLEDDLSQIDSFNSFKLLVERLEKIGLISPEVGALNWGDFRKTNPICHVTGFTRGTPIDRYYLQKFVNKIKDQVVGNVLEVGGVAKDREFYQFDLASTYRIMNLESGSGIDLVGDVHDVSLIETESLDGVVIFNVLEHCYSPWIAVENIYKWLKPGGKCFCMVPNAQRLHDRPGDYWRPLPDGVNWLFRNFSQRQLSVYGNPLTVIASFHGVATEELTSEELDEFHADYPVSTCIVATK